VLGCVVALVPLNGLLAVHFESAQAVRSHLLVGHYLFVQVADSNNLSRLGAFFARVLGYVQLLLQSEGGLIDLVVFAVEAHLQNFLGVIGLIGRLSFKGSKGNNRLVLFWFSMFFQFLVQFILLGALVGDALEAAEHVEVLEVGTGLRALVLLVVFVLEVDALVVD